MPTLSPQRFQHFEETSLFEMSKKSGAKKHKMDRGKNSELFQKPVVFESPESRLGGAKRRLLSISKISKRLTEAKLSNPGKAFPGRKKFESLFSKSFRYSKTHHSSKLVFAWYNNPSFPDDLICSIRIMNPIPYGTGFNEPPDEIDHAFTYRSSGIICSGSTVE